MPLARQPVHQRAVQPGPLVLGSTLLKSPTPTADRDRTVSRRSKPSSRTALMGEQPNPWDRLQPQDATSRHRTFLCRFPAAQTISPPCSTKSEGSACCGNHEFAVRHGLPPWRSATVVTGSLAEATLNTWSRFRQTSHGIAHRVQRRLGVHRYKPIPLAAFLPLHPKL